MRACARLVALACLAALGWCRVPACGQVPDPGPCRAFFRRFFWDNGTRTCEPFIYGGCMGAVPFRTAAECEAARCAIDTPVLGRNPDETEEYVEAVADPWWRRRFAKSRLKNVGRRVEFVANTAVA